MCTGTTTASSGTIPKFIQKLLRIHRILFFRLIKFILFIILIDSLSLLFPMKEDRLKFQRISSSNFSRRISIKRKSISIFQRFKKKLLERKKNLEAKKNATKAFFLSFYYGGRESGGRRAGRREARGEGDVSKYEMRIITRAYLALHRECNRVLRFSGTPRDHLSIGLCAPSRCHLWLTNASSLDSPN